MGRGFVKIGGAETDPEDIRMAEECWESGRRGDLQRNIRSGGAGRDQLHDQLQNAGRRKSGSGADGRGRKQVHVICTGRKNAHPKLVEAADLVTEMKEVKHPYTKGILAQRGIDY